MHVVEVARVLLVVARAAQVAVWGWQLAGPAHSLGGSASAKVPGQAGSIQAAALAIWCVCRRPLAQLRRAVSRGPEGRLVKPKREEPMAAADRHAARVAGLRRAVFDSPGVSGLAERAAAASADGVPLPLDAYVAKVDGAAYRITDADVAALQAAGCSEEEIFEVTVAAAVGAALRGLEAGMRAMCGGSEDAAGNP